MKKPPVLVLVLMMMFTVVPVMAKTQKVPATLNFNIISYEYGPRAWFNPNEFIFQERGSTLIFDIPDLDIGGSHHTGVWTSTFSDMVNFKTGSQIGHFKAVLTLDGSEDNGFAGNVELKQQLYEGQYTGHCVLQGFGVYDGQQLVLTYDGPWMWPATWTGYCLKG